MQFNLYTVKCKSHKESRNVGVVVFLFRPFSQIELNPSWSMGFYLNLDATTPIVEFLNWLLLNL